MESIRLRLPESARELVPFIKSDIASVHKEFENDLAVLETAGVDIVYNSLWLWDLAVKINNLDNHANNNELVTLAFQLCKALQFEVIEEVYQQLNIIDPLIDNEKYFVALTVVVAMHMFIPQLNDKLPCPAENTDSALGSNSCSTSNIKGPLTLAAEFKDIKFAADVDPQEFFKQTSAYSFDANSLYLLIDLFNSFRNASSSMQNDPSKCLEDVIDLIRSPASNNFALAKELATLTLLPQLVYVLQLIDSPVQSVAVNAKLVFQLVVTEGLLPAQKIGNDYTKDIISQSFSIPDGVLSLDFKRIHFDVLFEALDNTEKCLRNGSFVRLFALSAACLESTMSRESGALEFNRAISSLSPPLSSLATLCHLIYEISKKLAELKGWNMGLEVLGSLFHRWIPPIPLRHFNTAKSRRFEVATEGLDFEKVDTSLLVKSLNSLILALLKNVEFYYRMQSTDSDCDTFVRKSISLVVACLVCAYHHADSSMIERTLVQVVHSCSQFGLAALVDTILDISKHSIMFAGIGVRLVARVLELGNFSVILRQLETNHLSLLQMLEWWRQTNAPCMNLLVKQLQRYHMHDLLQQSSSGAISHSESFDLEPVFIDLTKISDIYANCPKMPSPANEKMQRRSVVTRSTSFLEDVF